MRLFLIRHPEPDGGACICYGRTDLPVSQDALDAAVARARDVMDGPAGYCVSSPLARCTRLARGLAKNISLDDRLAEIDFGSWEGQRWDDIDRAEFDHWAADHVHRRVPGGESWDDVCRRAASFLEDARALDAERVTAVTHAGVTRALLAVVLGTALEATWHIGVPFGCVVTVELGATSQDDSLVGITG